MRGPSSAGTGRNGDAIMGLLSTTDEWNDTVATWAGIQDAPARRNRRRVAGIRALNNSVLEKHFASSHWIMPGVWFIPVIVYCVYASVAVRGLTAPVIAMCIVAGVLGWSFVEYWLHRFVFHLPPTDIRPIRTVLFALHGYHHEFPSDRRRLVAPPVMSWPIASVLAVIYWSVFGAYWQALFAGTLVGYLAYDWMHYYTHHAVPRSRFGKFMRRFHMEHHFKNAETKYGLSSPLWDFVFLTYRRPTAPTPAEVECLGGDADPSDAAP